MKCNGKGKVILIVVIVAVILIAAGLGGWYFLSHRNTEPVNVFPFHYVGMTEYWGDSQESYGPISTDKIQTVFLSDTQTVTEILVQAGDTVQKGDLLMTFDTTLSDLALERQRLSVEKLKLQLENAQKELKDIKNMKPMVIPTPSEEPEEEENLGMMLSSAYQISQDKNYDGSAKEKALILWVSDTVSLDDAVLEAVRVKAQEYQQSNMPAEPAPDTTEPSTEATESSTEATEPTAETTEPSTEATEPTTETTEPSTEATEPTTKTTEPSTEPTEPSADPTEPPVETAVDKFYVVVKVTQGNMSLGAKTVWQGVEVTRAANGTFGFRFYDASALQDHTLNPQDTPADTAPEIDYGSGYTSAQIAQMRSDKEKEIKDLQFQIKMAEADYAIKKTEMETGEVRAQIDGTVVSLLSEDEAKLTMQPLMKLSGGGGFYMQGSVSELEKENLQIGQEVTVNDWNTGMQYTGTVQSVGDFPAADGYWNGMGNPNASYYPFTVFIDGSADLQEGAYVSVVYSTATNEQCIYLENPFLRTEQGRSYVYVRGSDGKLEKRYVTTGKSLWSSYTEVLDGLTAEDYIAFPYGKTIAEGADTVESDLSALYG